ncbi:MAG: hypothetical protein WDO24_03795 [Pseudomonadota bacterium]
MIDEREVRLMAQTIIEVKGDRALAHARRRLYASRRQQNEAASYQWLRVAQAIREHGQAQPRPAGGQT